ncbi:hypothetical protein BC629DRAFT_1032784 [Irpex lacteus]|nr:hypothetical protein BC629DRAFT_1032784 [Irpex lacteus]
MAVSEVTAGTSLGACIPPELFDNILFHVNALRIAQRSSDFRERGRPLCSLVCLSWANKCRRYMFSSQALEIRSYGDAEIFRRYAVRGYYQNRSSFLHLLYLPVIQHKLKYLAILGPIPVDFHRAKLDTPHWGIPPFIVLPSSFLQNKVSVGDVHLPSYKHVIKYISHFARATNIHFSRVTWDGEIPRSLPRVSNTIIRHLHRELCSVKISAKTCDDNLHLTLTAAMLNPQCPLHRLSDVERAWVIACMKLVWGDRGSRLCTIGFNVSSQKTTMYLSPFQFVFEEISATERSTRALGVIGVHAHIDFRYKYALPANLDQFGPLIHHLRTRPTIRVAVLLFTSLHNLKQAIQASTHVLDPVVTGSSTLFLVYEEEEERRAVGVDLVTLEPYGRIWVDLPKGERWDEEIFQRELKKRS